MNKQREQTIKKPYTHRLIISAILPVSLLITLILGLVLQNPGDNSFDLRMADLIDPEMNFVRVQLRNPEQEIEFYREDNGWILNTAGGIARARDSRVEDFLGSLFSLEFTRPLGQIQASDERFGFSEGSEIVLIDPQGRILVAILFGFTSSGTSEQYVRIDGSSDAYAVPTDLGFFLEQTELYWTDLRVWAIDPPPLETVARISRIWPDGDIERISRSQDGGWIDTDSNPISGNPSGLMNSFFRAEGLSVTGNLEDLPDSARFEFQINLELADGTIFTLDMYMDRSNSPLRYFAHGAEGPAVLHPSGEARLLELPDFRFEPLRDWEISPPES